MNSTYQVTVSNLGTIYSGDNEAEAQDQYAKAKAHSIEAMGRAAGEDVTLMYKGEPSIEFIGALSNHVANRHTDSQDAGGAHALQPSACDCPSCTLGNRIKARLAYALVSRIEARAMIEEGKAAHKDGALGYTVDQFIEHLPTLDGVDLEQGDKPALYTAIMRAIVEHTSGG